jgi:hypothetical protein
VGFASGLRLAPMDHEDERSPVENVSRGECPYIFGIHAADPGRPLQNLKLLQDYGRLYQGTGRRGWVLFTEGIGSDPTHIREHDFERWADAGYGVIVRLNHSQDGHGTLPEHKLYPDFAETCARYIELSRGCHIWIIGNEPNNTQEHPTKDNRISEHITPEMYAEAFNLAYQEIDKVRPLDQVVPAAMDPYFGVGLPLLGGRAYRPLEYFETVMAQIDKLDAVALHTYTHWLDVNQITSLDRFDAPSMPQGTPREHYLHFQAYRCFAEAIPSQWRKVPIYITETNHLSQSTTGPGAHGWLNRNARWVQEAYREIARWNSAPYAQQIHCLLLYRWSGDAWAISDLPAVQEDFRAALDQDYRWRE